MIRKKHSRGRVRRVYSDSENRQQGVKWPNQDLPAVNQPPRTTLVGVSETYKNIRVSPLGEIRCSLEKN